MSGSELVPAARKHSDAAGEPITAQLPADAGPAASTGPSHDLSPADDEPLLRVAGLRAGFHGPDGIIHTVLDGVDLTISPGEIVGLIGETGSGKTTLGRAIVGLVRPTAGTIRFEGAQIQGLRGRHRRALRRRGRIQFIFQDPLRSLDPAQRVADIVTEGLAIRRELDPAGRRQRAAEALVAVGLGPEFLDRLPGEISGGQRQRVAIARGIVTHPRLLICDEPVSALDAANRTHILRLLARLRDDQAIAMLIISHDLASMADVADRVAVLHNGRIVEEGPTARVFAAPTHPYTRLLIASSPRSARGLDPDSGSGADHGSSHDHDGSEHDGRDLDPATARPGPGDAVTG